MQTKQQNVNKNNSFNNSNMVTSGTAAGGSMHETEKNNVKNNVAPNNNHFDLLLQRMEAMNENFMKLTQSVNQLTKRVTNIEYDMSSYEMEQNSNADEEEYNEEDMQAEFHAHRNQDDQDALDIFLTPSPHTNVTVEGNLIQSQPHINPYEELKTAHEALIAENSNMHNHLQQLMLEVKALKEESQRQA